MGWGKGKHTDAEEKPKIQVCTWEEACNILHNGPEPVLPFVKKGRDIIRKEREGERKVPGL